MIKVKYDGCHEAIISSSTKLKTISVNTDTVAFTHYKLGNCATQSTFCFALNRPNPRYAIMACTDKQGISLQPQVSYQTPLENDVHMLLNTCSSPVTLA